MITHFTFFASYYDSVEHLGKDIKIEFFDALLKYALRDEIPDKLSPTVQALFIMAKPNVDKSKARSKAGGKGGKSKTRQKTNEYQEDMGQEEITDEIYLDEEEKTIKQNEICLNEKESKSKQNKICLNEKESKLKQDSFCLNQSVSDKEKDKEKDKDKEKEKKQKPSITYSDNFERFWKEYPRKQGKVKAYLSWKRQGCDSIMEKIMTSLESFKRSDAWKKDNGQYIPHGVTWVNGARWEDEVEAKEEKYCGTCRDFCKPGSPDHCHRNGGQKACKMYNLGEFRLTT